MSDGTRRHVASEGVAAAAGSRPACRRGDGGHDVDVRRLMSECDALGRIRLAHCSRGIGLGKDSPALRLCMETTRASLLWQAAYVRPEPEGIPSLRSAWPSCRSCIARVWGCSCFVILTNGAAGRARRDAPLRCILSGVCYALGSSDIAL